jgi:hypothetical protein
MLSCPRRLSFWYCCDKLPISHPYDICFFFLKCSVSGAGEGFSDGKLLSGFKFWTIIYDTELKLRSHWKCLIHFIVENIGCACLVWITENRVAVFVVEVIVLSGNITIVHVLLTVTRHRPNEGWESQRGQLLLLHWIMHCFVLFIYHQCVCGVCVCLWTVWQDQWRSGECFRWGPNVNVDAK